MAGLMLFVTSPEHNRDYWVGMKILILTPCTWIQKSTNPTMGNILQRSRVEKMANKRKHYSEDPGWQSLMKSVTFAPAKMLRCGSRNGKPLYWRGLGHRSIQSRINNPRLSGWAQLLRAMETTLKVSYHNDPPGGFNELLRLINKTTKKHFSRKRRRRR